MAKAAQIAAELAAPLVAAAGCTLWDTEYVREAGVWYLRVLIDKPSGVSTADCEAVSRPLSDALDEADPIEGSYVLEVGSPGLDRVLRRPEHFAAFLGSAVDVRLYRATDGRKVFTGTLDAFADCIVTVDGRPFPQKELAQVRLHVDF